MATKVFYRCIQTFTDAWIAGKEYERVHGQIVTEFGNELDCDDADDMCDFSSLNAAHFRRIEREVFTAHGFEWFKHVPGEPMPCDGEAITNTICQAEIDSVLRMNDRKAEQWAWNNGSSVIGWRFADSEQKEPFHALDAKRLNENADACFSINGQATVRGDVVQFATPYSDDDDSERNDLIAAVDDGHLTPGQKAYINAKEEKVAERLRSEAAKEELKKADHSKSIQDLANANGAVKFEHDPRMGWPS